MATKRFVPRGNNEGGLGDSARRWKEVHAATGSFYNGLSGSLQNLTDGSSYLVAGQNVTIQSGSSGQITISSNSGSFTLAGDTGTQVIAGSDTLTISGGSNIGTVGSATDTLTVNLDNNISIVGLTASNGVLLSSGVPSTTTNKLYNSSGTLTWNGTAIGAGLMTSFKVTGSHDVSSEITISEGNTLEISGSGAVSIITGPVDAITASLVLDGTTLQQSSSGLKVNPDLRLNSLTVDGTVTTIGTENLLVKDRFILLASGTTQASGEPPVQGGIIIASGALGTSQSLIFGASGSMWHTTQGDVQNGAITSLPPVAGSPSPYVPLGTSEIRLSGSNNKKLTTNGTDVILTSAGNLQFTGSTNFKDNALFNAGLSGSLQNLSNGTSYLAEGTGIQIATGSSGQITISSTVTSAEWKDEGSILRPDDGVAESVGIGGTGGSASSYDIFLSSDGSAVFNEQGNSVDFRIESDNSSSMFFVDGSTNKIGIGLNGPATTLHIKEPNPAVRIQRSSNSNSSSLEFAGSAGHIGSIVHSSNGNDLIFSTHNGSNPEEMLRLGSHYGSLNRQVILLSGSGVGPTSMQPKQSSDINFFVSGAIGSRGTSTKGTSVFGGDLHVSGNFTTSTSSGLFVPADNITLGDANASFKTSVGDIGISGSNIGLTGSIINIHGVNSTPFQIDNNDDSTKYKLKLENSSSIIFSQSTPKLSIISDDNIYIEANDKIQIKKKDVSPNSSLIGLGQGKITFLNVADEGELLQIDSTDDKIKIKGEITSSIYTFNNKSTSQSVGNNQLINITGSLFWKNPSSSTALKLLSGSEGGSSTIPADDITIGDAAVTITTTSGNTLLNSANGGTTTVSGSNIALTSENDITVTGDLKPATANTHDLGTTSAEWKDLYLGENSVIYFGSDQDVELVHDHNEGLILSMSNPSKHDPKFTIKGISNNQGPQLVLRSAHSGSASAARVKFEQELNNGSVADVSTIEVITDDLDGSNTRSRIGFEVRSNGSRDDALVITGSHNTDKGSVDIMNHDGSEAGLKLAGTLVTATAAELNLLDGGTSVGGSITLANTDGFVVNDAGIMKTIPASDIKTYVNAGSYTYQSKTSNFTAAARYHYGVATDSGNVIATLPAASSNANEEIRFKLKTGTNVLILNRAGSDTIDGMISVVMTDVSQSLSVMSDGSSNWEIF